MGDTLLRDHPVARTHRSARERRRVRRELVLRDRQSARLAELVLIREVLGRAADLIDRGWLQDAWFSYRSPDGDVRVSYVPAGGTHGMTVLSTCLVAAIRDAKGPHPTGGQVVRRALELTWHTLHGDRNQPVGWCPAPDVRAMHLRDLTRWNDRPGRTSAEVAALLEATMQAADGERHRVAAGCL